MCLAIVESRTRNLHCGCLFANYDIVHQPFFSNKSNTEICTPCGCSRPVEIRKRWHQPLGEIQNLMKYRVFWTCVLPEHLIAQYRLSFAACNFSFNLMGSGAFDKVYSSMPLYVGGKMQQEAFDDKRFELIYDRWREKGGLWQKLATFKEQFAIFRQIPKGSLIWLYNLNTLNAFLFLLLKLFKPSVQLNVIVLDFTPVNQGLGLNQIYLKLINWAHGRICLANSKLFNKTNSVTLPGVVPIPTKMPPEIKTTTRSFLLSGVLTEEISMLAMVLDTFSKLPDCELHITGSKGNDELLKQYANKYPNIHWHGQLPFNKYLELLHSVTFQLSTRNPQMPENQCNFPSKIMEALHHNRIVISTIHYPQLGNVKYFSVNHDKEDFLNDIKKIAYMHNDTLLTYANQGKLVSKLFGVNVWNDAMLKIEKKAL